MAEGGAVAAGLRRGFGSMLRRGLRGVWWRGALPDGPFVWAANHHSWWDPFLASAVLDRARRPVCLLMAQDNLARFDFVRRLGVFGTGEPRRGLSYLDSGRVLVVYPEGELRPAGAVGPLADGAAWFARRAGVPLCPVAVRVVLRGHEVPEAYLSLAQVPSSGAPGPTTAELARRLDAELAAVDRLVAAADPREPLPGFSRLLTGRRSWDERIDAMAGWRPWR
jgi:1-acyl-sn-glycerol-3-phosphate acyltransferase